MKNEMNSKKATTPSTWTRTRTRAHAQTELEIITFVANEQIDYNVLFCEHCLEAIQLVVVKYIYVQYMVQYSMV